jgi:hypothetical protein
MNLGLVPHQCLNFVWALPLSSITRNPSSRVAVLKGGLGTMWAEMELHSDQLEDTIEQMHPGLYSMKANSDDNPTWNQAMGGPDAKEYWQAAKFEYETLTKMDV